MIADLSLPNAKMPTGSDRNSLTDSAHKRLTLEHKGSTQMKTIQGPGIFLAQFASDAPPFNTFDTICAWAASLGYLAVQIPSWDARLFDLKRAAESKAYCDEVASVAARHKLVMSELSTHLQGQLVACHP